MKSIIQILIAFSLFLPLQGWAATYYVDQNGNDAADGTTYVKRASVAYHNAGSGVFAALDGDTVILSGTINSQVVVPDSGSAGNVITYDGDDGVNPACTIDMNGGDSGFVISNGSSSVRSYVTVQDLIVTDFNTNDGGIMCYGGTGGAPHDITVKRCTVHTGIQKGICVSDSTFGGVDSEPYNIIIGGASGDGNTVYNIGTTTAGMDINTSYAHDVVISYNHLYANNASYGIDGIHLIEGYRQLIEYNTVHGHNRAGAENALDIKGGCHDIIVRFNHFYDHTYVEPNIIVQTVRGGPGDSDHVSDIYIYGNSIHDGVGGIALFPKEGYDISNVYIWANLVYNHTNWGISITYNTSGNSVSNYYVLNNVIAENGEGSTSRTGHTYLSLTGTNRIIKNNIFYTNRPGSSDYIQRYADSTSNLTFDYNRYHWPGHTSNAYWGSSSVAAAALEANGSDGDPGLTNAGSHNYTLTGESACKDTGLAISGPTYSAVLLNFMNSHGGVHYFSDGLDDSYVNWNTTPPTVRLVPHTDYNLTDKGAYVFTEGGGSNQAPNGSIDTPASNTTVDEDDEVTLAGSGVDPESDPITFVWIIPAETFKEWDAGTTYAAHYLVEDPDAGDSGDFYKSKAGSNLNHEPPNTTYWENAETQQNPGTGKCDTAGIYNISLTVSDDAPLADPTPATVAITVNDPGGGASPTTEVWTRNAAGGHYAKDETTYINGDTGACTSSETITNETTEYHVSRYDASTYRGSEIAKTGGYPDGCEIKLKLKRTGACTGKSVYIYEIPLTGSDLDLENKQEVASLDATTISDSVFTVYEFSCSHDLTEGSYLIVTVSGTASASNYVEFRIDTDSQANLGDLGYWNSGGTYGGNANYDFYIEIWEATTSYVNTNYGTGNSIYAKKISTGGDDNQKIVYLVDLSDIVGETVTDAKLELYLETAPSSNINVELWSGVDVTTETGATWSCAVDDNNDGACDTAWTGTHGQTTFLKEVAFTSGSSTGQYYVWQNNDFTSYINSRAGLIAYLILYSDANDTSAIAFTSDDGDDTQRPKLTIEYGASDPASVPEIVNITCSTADGSYKDGDSIGPFQISFSEPVDVTGVPQLTLELGANDAVVNYSSGSGTATLTFAAFNVASGSSHTTADLDATQLDRNGGDIESTDDATAVADAEPDDILDVFPTAATIGALAYNKAIIVDTAQAGASSVNNTDTAASKDVDSPFTVVDTIIKFAIVFDETGLQINAEPGYPRIEMTVHPTDTVYAYAIGLGDTTGTIIMAFPLTAGMRSLDLNFTGNLDLGPGGVITDGAGNDIAVAMGALDLSAVADIVIAVPFPPTDPKEFTDTADYVAWLAASNYTLPDDHLNWIEAAGTEAFDASGEDGTSGHEIIYSGGGFTITGTQIFGDYSVVKNFIHASTVTMGVGSVHSGSIVPVGSTLVIPNGTTTCYIYNDGIGTLDLNGACNVYNTWAAVVDPAGLSATEPVVFTNCYFIESEAVIEAKDGDDDLTFTDCTFEITTGDFFVNYGGGDYTLKPGCTWRHSGTHTVGYETKLRPAGGTMTNILSVGPYGIPGSAAGVM